MIVRLSDDSSGSETACTAPSSPTNAPMSFTPAQMEQDGGTERAHLENLKQGQIGMRSQLADINNDITTLNKTLGNINIALNSLALPPTQATHSAPPIVPPFNPPPVVPPPRPLNVHA